MSDLLRQLASLAPPTALTVQRASRASTPPLPIPADGDTTGMYAVDLDAFIQRHGLTIQRSEPYDGGTRHILDRCLFDPSHDKTSAILGRGSEGGIYYKCSHNTCLNLTWKDVCQLLEGRDTAPVDALPTPITSPPANGDGLIPIPENSKRKKGKGNKKSDGSSKEDVKDFMEIAREYMQNAHSTVSGHLGIAWYREEFWVWGGRSYKRLRGKEFAALVLRWMDQHGHHAHPRDAGYVCECIGSLTHVPSDVEQPVFIEDTKRPLPLDWIALQNGIISLSDLIEATVVTIRPHTPQWFSPMVLPFEFNPDSTCSLWIDKLNEILDQDAERIALVQEMFGLCLTTDTRYQAVFMLEGPPRSGKGTILRQLQKVIGVENCVSPRLTGLGEQFSLQGLIGKRVAILPDAHLGHGDKALSVLETLKSISGEDACEIHRKHMDSIPHARLRIRFVMAVNELPKFSDHGKTLSSRVKIVPFRQSFLGREDLTLESRLETELAGTFNWAVEGLRRLSSQRRLTQPSISEQIEQDFARLSSPLQAFIEDCCEVGMDKEVQSSLLFQWWEWWCKKYGHLAGSQESLGVRLRSLIPNIQKTDPRTVWETGADGQAESARRRFYVGIGIKAQAEMDG